MSLPRLFKPFQQVHGASVHPLLSAWFKTELGQELLQQERDILDRVLPSLFGYHLVQTGIGEPQWLAEASTIHNKLFVSKILDISWSWILLVHLTCHYSPHITVNTCNWI